MIFVYNFTPFPKLNLINNQQKCLNFQLQANTQYASDILTNRCITISKEQKKLLHKIGNKQKQNKFNVICKI